MYKRYSKYKDSGIEWVGDIPEQWDVKKLKFLMMNLDSRRIPLSSEERAEMRGDYPYYGSNGIVDHVNNFLFDGEYILLGEDGAPFFEAYKDVAFLVDGKFWANNHAHILKAFKGYNQRFLTYALNSVDYLRHITGSTRDKLTQDDMVSIQFPVPDENEQNKIAVYLSNKTSQIDDLIAKKESMIELLKEERAAVINNAVTKGLNPDAKVKDPGIEWLGEIPTHWRIKRIKYNALINRETLPETTDDNYEFNYIDIGNVNLEEGYKLNDKLRFAMAPSRARRFVKIGDTIVSTVRTYLKAITFFDEHVQDLIVSTGFAVLSPKDAILPKYLYYILRSEKFIDRICALSVGVSYPAINADDISNIYTWYPADKKEQMEIVNYLDDILAKNKSIISRLQSEIELLKEYRTALISEVVTGKIDVREAVKC